MTGSLDRYIKKLTKTILDMSIINGNDSEDFLYECIKALLDNDNNTLLKKQLQFMVKDLDSNYSYDKGSIKLDFEKMHNEILDSNYVLKTHLLEKNIVIRALIENDIGILEDSFVVKLNRNDAEKVLNSCYSYATEELDNMLSKCDYEQMLFLIYGASDVLSHMSNLIYSKLRINENNQISNRTDNDFLLLLTSLSNMSKTELMEASYVIGSHKYYCDYLFHHMYYLYLHDTGGEAGKCDVCELSDLIECVALIVKFDLQIQSLSLLYEKDNFFYIKDYAVNESGDFIEKLKLLNDDAVKFEYDTESTKLVFDKYRLLEGFNGDNAMELTLALEKSLGYKGNRPTTHLLTFPYEKVEGFATQVCSIDAKRVGNFLNSITLIKPKKIKFNYNHKVSLTPIVKLKDDRVLLSVSMLLQSSTTLNARLLQQSFTSNGRLKRFIQKNYDEANIENIRNAIQKKGIDCWANMNLSETSNKELRKQLSEKGYSSELDIVYLYENRLYVLEYKTWKLSAYTIRDFLNELKKVEKHAKKKLESLGIVEKNITSFDNLFGHKTSEIDEIKLIMVFQNPNAYNYFSDISQFITISYTDLMIKINRGELDF